MAIKNGTRILILGAQQVGKTTLCEALLQQFPELKYVGINQIRSRLKVTDIVGEYQAKDEFIRLAARTRRPVLIECSGVGVTAYMLSAELKRLRKGSVHVFYLKPQGLKTPEGSQHPDGALYYFANWKPQTITTVDLKERIGAIEKILHAPEKTNNL